MNVATEVEPQVCGRGSLPDVFRRGGSPARRGGEKKELNSPCLAEPFLQGGGGGL